MAMPTLTQNASQNFVASVVLIVLTSLCVSIRIVLKLRRRQIPQGPDWMCFLGTAVFITYCSLIINCEFAPFPPFPHNHAGGILGIEFRTAWDEYDGPPTKSPLVIFNVSETHALDFDFTLGVDYGHKLAKVKRPLDY